MRCPECGFPNPDDVPHCFICGAALIAADAPPGTTEDVADLKQRLSDAQQAVRQLRRYVPSVVADGILHDRARLRGERREATVLFADAVNFTSLSASLDAESVFNLINDLLGRLVDCVHRYDGMVDKFTGDGLMAVFGAPVAHENDAELAVRAALDIHQAAVAFEPVARAQLGAPLKIRIGIHCGPVIAGILGTNEQLAYTVIGETVNLAARLESLAQPSSILVSDRVYQYTQALFDFHPTGLTHIKGVAQPLAVYEVMGQRSAPLPTRGVIGVTAILLGRDAELAQLTALSDGFLDDHQGRLVTIEGEAGLGKSRLVSEWLATFSTQQVSVWTGRGLPYAGGVGYGVFRALLQDAAPDEAASSPAAPSSSTDQPDTAAWDAHVSPDLRPFLHHMLGLLDPEERQTVDHLEPERVKQLTVTALREWVLGQARQAPIVLILEDFHWADDLSRDALQSLVSVIYEAPVLLCVTSRPRPDAPLALLDVVAPDEAPVGPRRSDLRLDPLSPEHSRALLAHLIDLDDLPPQLVETILMRAEGNPFYIEEFVRMLIEKENLSLQEGRWRVDSTMEWQAVEIPATLRGLMMARVDRLPEHLAHVLRDAAVVGMEFDARLLQEVERRLRGQTDVLPLLERLKELGVLVAQSQADGGYAFRHLLTQETIYNSLLRSQRPTLHRTVAECIEYLNADSLSDHAEVLALHYDRAYVRPKAMQYALLAGERARKRFANREAIEYYSRALQISQHLGGYGAERWQAAIGLGEVLQHVGEYDEAIACYQAALDEWQGAAPQSRAWTMFRLGRVWDRRGELDEAEGWLRQALAQLSQARTKFPDLRAQVYSELGWISLRRGDVATARDWLGQGLDLVGSTAHYNVLSLIFDRLGAVHDRRSEWREAARCLERALEHRERLGDIVGYAHSLNSLARIKWVSGDWAGALADYEQAAELYERIGEVEGQAHVYTNLGVLYTDRGEWDKAEENLHRALSVAQRLGQPYELAQGHLHLGRLHLFLERWCEAGEHLNAAAPLYAEAGVRAEADLGQVYCWQGVLHLEQGRLDDAWQWVDRCGAVLRKSSGVEDGDSIQWGRYERLMGRIAMAGGDLDGAQRHLKRGMTIFQGRGAKLDVGRAAYWRGVLLLEVGQTVQGVEMLHQARDVFENLGAGWDLQRVARRLAQT